MALTWDSLKPSKLVDVTLAKPIAPRSKAYSLYIMESWYFCTDLSKLKLQGIRVNSLSKVGHIGLIVKHYGLSTAHYLNNSYELVYDSNSNASHSSINLVSQLLEKRIHTLMRKKKKRGYVDKTLDFSFSVNIQANLKAHDVLDYGNLGNSEMRRRLNEDLTTRLTTPDEPTYTKLL